ncbi:MAG: ExbD/TolR family protein [Gemmatimonadaceae bacterium]
MTISWKLLLGIALLGAACSKEEQPEIPADAMTIGVYANGSVFVNGIRVDTDGLESALQNAAATQKQVWYYRENPTSEAPPHAVDVINRIADHQLQVSMSSRPNFCDYIDENGTSRGRPGRKCSGSWLGIKVGGKRVAL